jgi:arginyl-tRNA--protein-N-Asp/Glu arginylyltransferase
MFLFTRYTGSKRYTKMLISPKYPDLDVDAAVVYYYEEKDKSISQIAKGLGLSRFQIHRILIRKGFKLSGSNPKKTTRDCQTCHETKPLTEEFWHWKNKAAGKFQYICRECRAASGR